MTGDEYTELGRELLDKMKEFIHASEPGESLIPLHKAYTVVKTTVDAADPDSEVARNKRRLEDARRTLDEIRERDRERNQRRNSDQGTREERNRAMDEAREGWTGLDRNVKMGRILTALGREGLTRARSGNESGAPTPRSRFMTATFCLFSMRCWEQGSWTVRRSRALRTAPSRQRVATGGGGDDASPTCRPNCKT